MKVKLTTREIRDYLKIASPNLPKYAAPLINLVNQYAQATRPKVVGQMTQLIEQFPGKTLSEWEEWYLKQKPNAIEEATNKVLQKAEELKTVFAKIDRETIREWVRDLVIVKTFSGLKFQEAILKKGAEIKKTDYRFANLNEESKGIDEYIGKTPVSIKPYSYQSKSALPESIHCKIIYYQKIKNGIEVDFSEILYP